MTNYNELSDFEINKRVAKSNEVVIEHLTESSVFVSDNDSEFNYKVYDPCNNPADAWPIIVCNHISLQAYATEHSAYPLSDKDILSTSKNPLRAAMIVFLMMNEKEVDKQ